MLKDKLSYESICWKIVLSNLCFIAKLSTLRNSLVFVIANNMNNNQFDINTICNFVKQK